MKLAAIAIPIIFIVATLLNSLAHAGEATMSDKFKPVNDKLMVSPQITPEEIADAAKLGVTLIINNRPDGEMIGQPRGEAIEKAARAAGIDYVFIPVDGRGITMEGVTAFQDALANQQDGKILAFCRSGTRSITMASYAAAYAGAPVDQIIEDAAAAGYDISSHKQALNALYENAAQNADKVE